MRAAPRVGRLEPSGLISQAEKKERKRLIRSVTQPGGGHWMVRRKGEIKTLLRWWCCRCCISMKKLSSVVVSPANSALPLTAVFVLWIFLHSCPVSLFLSPPPLSLPLCAVVDSPPLRRLHPLTFCKHFIREPLVFSKAPRQTDRAAVNRAQGEPREQISGKLRSEQQCD